MPVPLSPHVCAEIIIRFGLRRPLNALENLTMQFKNGGSLQVQGQQLGKSPGCMRDQQF